MANFALIGVGGFIAPRHLAAIKDNGHRLILATDPNDSVGVLDSYFPDCLFHTEFAKFAEDVERLKGTESQIEYVAICSPNHWHAEHIRFALNHGAHAICEKPLVLTVNELDELVALEKSTGRQVFTILQLRLHEAILALKAKVDANTRDHYDVSLTYMTSRGPWYLESWKGDESKSGGLSTNIGIHFFDMLTWIFGAAREIVVTEKTAVSERGVLQLDRAKVDWELTIDRKRLPPEAIRAGKTTYRSIRIDGEEFEFSEGFTELHKKVYADIFSGRGFGLLEARPAIDVAQKIRSARQAQ